MYTLPSPQDTVIEMMAAVLSCVAELDRAWSRQEKPDAARRRMMAWDSLMDVQTAQSQEEDQEDQGEVPGLGGTPHSFQGALILLAFLKGSRLPRNP